LDSYITCVNHVNPCYQMRKNVNYEILLLHSSLKIMSVCICVCVWGGGGVYTHARTQIMHANPLSVNFHYIWSCWLLRYRFTIFSHLILMSFLFPLCFNYSLLRNNADHRSTDSYTHLASETNSLRSRILSISITFLVDFSGESVERSLNGKWIWMNINW